MVDNPYLCCNDYNHIIISEEKHECEVSITCCRLSG